MTIVICDICRRDLFSPHNVLGEMPKLRNEAADQHICYACKDKLESHERR